MCVFYLVRVAYRCFTSPVQTAFQGCQLSWVTRYSSCKVQHYCGCSQIDSSLCSPDWPLLLLDLKPVMILKHNIASFTSSYRLLFRAANDKLLTVSPKSRQVLNFACKLSSVAITRTTCILIAY